MGDTGSMFLGGCVVAMAFGVGAPLLLGLIGLIYICESPVSYTHLDVYKRQTPMSRARSSRSSPPPWRSTPGSAAPPGNITPVPAFISWRGGAKPAGRPPATVPLKMCIRDSPSPFLLLASSFLFIAIQPGGKIAFGRAIPFRQGASHLFRQQVVSKNARRKTFLLVRGAAKKIGINRCV